MRRMFAALILIFSVLSSVFGVRTDTRNQIVSGYIGTNVKCTIEEFLYENSNDGKGINLDINDENNNYRYLIAPTAVALSKPGLLVGNFSIISSTPDIRLIISPGKLINGSDSSIQYDYELAVSYILESNSTQTSQTQICKSGSSLTIDFRNAGGVVIANDAGIYFRLCSEITAEGLYASTISFQLEAVQ